ncbi:Platinum sensitivity protein, partial [Coemansia sp. RSA 2705]
MSADSQVRVKVYQLDKDTNWTDRGTGFCTLEDCQGIPHLSVVAENGASQLLLDCVVQKGEVYQLQECRILVLQCASNSANQLDAPGWPAVHIATLIVWTEPSGEDMALSFQEQEGCQSILNQIHEFDRLLKEHTLDQSKQPVGIELPAPSMGNLDEVERTIIECNKTVALRDQLVLFITHESYLDQLRDLHETCEELEAVEELHTIYSIIRHILLLNDSSIFECIIRDDNIIGVAGMLEYDPLSPVKPGTYRDFLRYQSHFEEIVPFEDPEIEDRIHQSFRLQYLKDVVLAQMIDEGMLSAINAGLFYNHAQIANYIHHTPAFADKLFGIIRRHENPKKMHGVVQFVRQYFAMTKNFPVAYRLGLFRSLSQHGLFAVFEYTLQQGDRALRVVGADMLMSMLDQDRMLVRSYMLDQQSQAHKEPTLLELIIQGLQGDECPEIQHTCREAMRILLDTVGPPFESMDMSTDLMAGTMAEKETDGFLGMFYDTQAERLLAPLLRLTP